MPDFHNLSLEDKVRILLCPTNATAAKLTNKYIKLIFQNRTKLDNGVPLSQINPYDNNFDIDSNANS